MKPELWPAYLVFFASLIASLGAAFTVGSLVEAREKIHFFNSAEQWTRHIEGGLSKYCALLESVRALAVANVSMKPGQFEGYVKALDLETNYRGITGLGVAVKIASSQRAELIQKAREQGMPQFRVWPESDASELCPVVILDPPTERNLATLGYDFFAEPHLRSVAKTASEAGKPAATEAMTSIFKTEASQRHAFFVFTPIYRGGGLPQTLEERRGAFMGIVLCVFEPLELLQAIASAGRQPKTDLRIYDGDTLYFESQEISNSAEPLRMTKHLAIAGRDWTCVFSSHQVRRASLLNPAVLTLLGGFVLSGLIYAITATQIRARTAAEKHAAQIKELNFGLEQRVADRTAELESAVEDLKAFSYSVSHDLRAPIRHIDGYANVLKENPIIARDEEARCVAERVSKAARSMSALVDALLKFAHAGQIDLALAAQVNVKDLVMEVREMFTNEIKDRKIAWTIGELPAVTADRMLLRQVFANLIGNAIKYSAPRSEAVIEIGSKEHDRELIFFVRDNGVGFDMKYAAKLFGMFQRLHCPEDFEGTGIGLANVRKIVSRHGGRTWAESEPGQGAVFYFTLPKKPGGREP